MVVFRVPKRHPVARGDMQLYTYGTSGNVDDTKETDRILDLVGNHAFGIGNQPIFVAGDFNVR